MNDIESRLTDAMAARAREVEPHDEDDALNRISERVTMSHRRTLMILGAAAVVAVAVGTVALLNRDDEKGGRTITAATDSGSTTPPTVTTPVSVIPGSDEHPIWPLESMNRTYATREEAAKSFAVDYLGMTHARLGTTTGDDVEIFPNDRGNARTVVHTAELSTHTFGVTGADADEIVLDTPKPNDPLAPTMTVSGRSVAFEAQVGIQLRPFGLVTSDLDDYVMGGSSEMQPFSKQISVPKTDQAHVLILFEGDASGEQTFTKATVRLLTPAGEPEPATFIGQALNGDIMLLDFAGHVQRPATAQDKAALENPATLPPNVPGELPTLRGRFGTIAFHDGEYITSYNPTTGAIVHLVRPPDAPPVVIDADASGRHLLWVDTNHDLWTWSGGAPVKVGTGFVSAAW
ncbi:MAG: hypothetical protein QOD92_1410 [Acidimicrobiaceae bacterium]|jgi:hypothetical protein